MYTGKCELLPPGTYLFLEVGGILQDVTLAGLN